MKKTAQFLAIVLMGLTLHAQEEVNISMGSGYADRVFYKLSDGATNSYLNSEWDIAFYRMSNFAFATRINDGKGIKVYEATNNSADWENINVSDAGSWTELYNSDTEWEIGAFDNGSATYGWGEYNPANHHVQGTVIFVLEYANGSYKKFIIEDFFGGYTFKYSSWNGSAWSADQTQTISNSTNPENVFNYFSLENNAEVIAEPASNAWDLVFTKYTTDLGGGVMYSVTGALHHPDIEVAKHDETQGEANIDELEYLSEINTIGYDWKTFNGSVFVVDSDTGYYVKYTDGTVYRVVFTEFGGSASGDVSFTVENMGTLGTSDFGNNHSFTLYPNPAVNKNVTLLLDLKGADSNAVVSIYNMSGSQVFETTVNTTGFVQKELQLSHLTAGVYLVNVNAGGQNAVKKLVIK